MLVEDFNCSEVRGRRMKAHVKILEEIIVETNHE